MGKRIAKKVVVIGWDAADWGVIMPLIDQGKMPTLKKLMDEGSWGNFATMDPPLSPILWTSMGTGKMPEKHGILGFIEPTPEGNGVRPVSNKSRKCKAVWNILNQEGFKSNVISWWPSEPVEKINGTMVSNHFQKAKGEKLNEWTISKDAVHPEELKKALFNLRVHPSELTPAHITPFLPHLANLDIEKEKKINSIIKILAETATVHSASTYVMENYEWDFTAIYHDSIDHYCHVAMKYHPPRRPFVPEEKYEIYKNVVEAAYRFHDMMLERTLKLAGEDATIILCSDHGFHSDHLRPEKLPKEPAAPAHEHSPYGVVVMKGPGIKKGERIYGATVIDLTPTILHQFGLPIGEDMDGKPITSCLEEEVPVDKIPSWEEVEGDSAMHDPNEIEDTWASQEAMQQLIELGYVDAPEEDMQKNIDRAKNESQFYLARSMAYNNEYDKAIPLLEKLFEDNPDVLRYAYYLANCYLERKKYASGFALIDKIRSYSDNNPSRVDLIEALFLIATFRFKKAEKILEKILKDFPQNIDIRLQVGQLYNSRRKFAEAEKMFREILEIDPKSAFAHHGLGFSLLKQDKLDESLDYLLESTQLKYFYPATHYNIGEVLYKMEEYESAEMAFRLVVSMKPGHLKAHKWLSHLYKDIFNKPELAVPHDELIKEHMKGEIIIVSGLPRSGTSMMMQMLDKGGVEVLTDGVRQADNSNPKGYYEYEKVKKLMVDKSWLPEADGKAVKVIAQLVSHLPMDYNYKIIFMERDINEVLQSQQVMLGKSVDKAAQNFPAGLSETFKKQVSQMDTWVDSQPKVEMIKVNYSEVIKSADDQITRLESFLDTELNREEMKKVVDKTLYRNKMVEN